MSLESLVLTASHFAASDVRDTIYALLYLANDMHDVVDTSSASQVQHRFTSDYSRHPVDIFKDFVRYSIGKSNSLDVLYRHWACWSHLNARYGYNERLLPSWIGAAIFGQNRSESRYHIPSDSLLGPVGSQVYHASHCISFKGQSIPPTIDDTIQLEGMLLGTVDVASVSAVTRGLIRSDWLRTLGWCGTLDGGIDDQLWRTLVANRDPESKVAPTWYRRACALALTQLDHLGDLNSEALAADPSQPSTLIEYLKRVQNATAHKKIFRCASVESEVKKSPTGSQRKVADAIVGLGPEQMTGEDESLVCILYGSSVPVILSLIDDERLQSGDICHVKLVGACYVHGHMEGEIFASMGEKEFQGRTMKFSIH
ncbi:uncharacterized protein J4E92_005424 [Alternaria infectoria]|uniref:uncharacterized protein n=1 Tax=Alternaria infectoria TaxID=45303 RepID=UPI00221E7D2F|nr:uncharacterized protein J4E92_005424 [Alternaria infectoria]KAI4927944.1 hypothetical protein J4E92_005424 [Alternaria infectoria]